MSWFDELKYLYCIICYMESQFFVQCYFLLSSSVSLPENMLKFSSSSIVNFTKKLCNAVEAKIKFVNNLPQDIIFSECVLLCSCESSNLQTYCHFLFNQPAYV